jgi:restriction system protein
MSYRPQFRGWVGELKTIIAKKVFLPSRDYVDLNNVTIPTHSGTAQIDHVIVSRFGVFVVESKNMNGLIFGRADDPQWTKLNRGYALKFQNPLHQNDGHIRALSRLVGIQRDKLHSVVIFWGNCSLETAMPPNVLTRGYTTYIKSKTQALLDEAEVRYILAALKVAKLPRTSATHLSHVDHLRQRFENTATCARCGSPMVLRIARSGGNTGNQFYGCSRYPSCRYARNADPLLSRLTGE